MLDGTTSTRITLRLERLKAMWCRDQRKGKERLKMDQAICQESYGLGTGQATKTDEFSEKFQTAIDPPPHFRKTM